MPRRGVINWKLIFVLVLALGVLAATAIALRQWNRHRKARSSLDSGLAAYQDGNYQMAIEQLSRYIYSTPDTPEKIPVLIKFADAILMYRPASRYDLNHAIDAYERVVRLESQFKGTDSIDQQPSDAALYLMELYLQLNQSAEACRLAGTLLPSRPSGRLRLLYAAALQQSDDYATAADVLQQTIAADPANIEAYDMLARLLENNPSPRLPAPAHWYDQAVQANPDNPAAWLIRGGFAFRQGRIDDLRKDLDRAAKLPRSSDVDTRILQAQLHLSLQEYEPARAALMAAQQADPAQLNLWKVWARLALQTDDKPAMIRVADEAMTSLRRDAVMFLPMAAKLYIRADLTDRASDLIERMRKLGLFAADRYFLEGLIAEQRQDYEQALHLFYQALDQGYPAEELRLALARVALKKQNLDLAVSQLRLLLSEFPDQTDARLNLADLLIRQGQWLQARREAEAVLLEHPDSRRAAVLAITAQLQELRQNHESPSTSVLSLLTQRMNRLLQRFPDDLDIRLLNVRLAAARGLSDQVDAELTRLEEKHPADADVVQARVEFFLRNQQVDRARGLLEEMHSRFPENDFYTRELARLLARQDDFSQARQLLAEAIDQADIPERKVDLSLFLVHLLRQQEQPDRAWETLVALARTYPENPTVLIELLELPQSLEKPQQAQEWINQLKSDEGSDGLLWRYYQARLWFLTDQPNERHGDIIRLLSEILNRDPTEPRAILLMGKIHESAGQWRQALEVYAPLLEQGWRQPTLIAAYINALIQTDQIDRAVQWLDKTSAEGIHHPDLERLRLRCLLLYPGDTSPEEILANLDTYCRDHPDDIEMALSAVSVLIDLDRHDEADARLQKLHENHPREIRIQQAYIDLALLRDQPDQVRKLCQDLLVDHPDAEGLIVAAGADIALGDYKQAEQYLNQATEKQPQYYQAWLALSNLLRTQNRSAEAIKAADQALALRPADPEVQQFMIMLLRSSDAPADRQRSQDLLLQALNENPNDLELRLLEVSDMLDRRTRDAYNTALARLQNLTSTHPQDIRSWLILGDLYLQDQQPDRALTLALGGLSYHPRNKELFLLKAHAEAQQAPSAALATLSALGDLYPGDVDVTLNRVDLMLSVEEYDQARRLLEEVMARRISSADRRLLQLALVNVNLQSNHLADAQAILDQRRDDVVKDPDVFQAQCHLYLARDETEMFLTLVREAGADPDRRPDILALSDQLRLSEEPSDQILARQLVDILLKRNPDDVSALMRSALLQQTAGHLDQAVQIQKRILQIDPTNTVAINNLAWILAVEMDQLPEALEWANKGLQSASAPANGEVADLLDTRGVIYYRMGRHAEALADLEQALSLYPLQHMARAGIHLHLAQVQLALGNGDQARRFLVQAAELHRRHHSLSPGDIHLLENLLHQQNLDEYLPL